MMRRAGLGRIWAIIVPLALVAAGCKPENEYKPLEDFLFRQPLLDHDGQGHLLELAAEIPLVGEIDRACQLLRECASSTGRAAAKKNGFREYP